MAPPHSAAAGVAPRGQRPRPRARRRVASPSIHCTRGSRPNHTRWRRAKRRVRRTAASNASSSVGISPAKMREHLAVADRLASGARQRSVGGQRAHFVDQARRAHRVEALARSARPARGASNSRPSIVTEIAGAAYSSMPGPERREPPPGELDHFERAHDAPPIAGLHARRGRPDRARSSRAYARASPASSSASRVERVAHAPHRSAGSRGRRRPPARRGRCRPRATPACRAPRCRRSRPRAATCVRCTDHSSAGSATSTRWCTTSARSARVGLAVPMSRPRYTCIESSDTSSTSPASPRDRRAPAPTCPTRSGRRARDVGSNRHDRDANPPPACRANPFDHLAAQPVRRGARDARRDEIAARAVLGASGAKCRSLLWRVRPDHIAGSVFDGPSTSTSSTTPDARVVLHERASARPPPSAASIRSRIDLGLDEVVGHRRGLGARPRREHERVRGVVLRGLDDLERLLEVVVRSRPGTRR